MTDFDFVRRAGRPRVRVQSNKMRSLSWVPCIVCGNRTSSTRAHGPLGMVCFRSECRWWMAYITVWCEVQGIEPISFKEYMRRTLTMHQ